MRRQRTRSRRAGSVGCAGERGRAAMGPAPKPSCRRHEERAVTSTGRVCPRTAILLAPEPFESLPSDVTARSPIPSLPKACREGTAPRCHRHPGVGAALGTGAASPPPARPEAAIRGQPGPGRGCTCPSRPSVTRYEPTGTAAVPGAGAAIPPPRPVPSGLAAPRAGGAGAGRRGGGGGGSPARTGSAGDGAGAAVAPVAASPPLPSPPSRAPSLCGARAAVSGSAPLGSRQPGVPRGR